MMHYPRSFLKLLLIGLTVVAVPFLAALITSAIAVDRLASRSQNAVYQAVQATQNSRRLNELLTAMERSARQIVILNDRGLLDGYKISRSQFVDTAAKLTELPFDAQQHADLDAITKLEQQIFDSLNDPALKPANLKARVSQFGELSARAQAIMEKSGHLIDREVEAMREAADQARRIMIWQVLGLIPVMVFLVVGFTMLISRPIRQIDNAIRELGDGKFNTKIVVDGPKDLEYLGERLEWMRCNLIDIEQQKNRFLQQVSHELKTPLAALREGAQLLSDNVIGRLTPEQLEIVQILRHNSLELQRRIEQLLDYGSIQFHKLKLNVAPIMPRQILARVAQNHKLALQAKNILLQTQPGDVTLVADEEKVRAILDNLLSNAIRYSPEGGNITVNMRRDGRDLVIDVTDQGPGIDATDLPHIFEPFYRGRNQGAGMVKGTGLGLSIVKEYVAAHGGSVEVITVPDDLGAHLRARLPLNQPEVT